MSRFRSEIGLDSQNPVSLLPARGFIKVFGSPHPTRFNTRDSAEVPLRCMPATRIAILFLP